MILKNGLICVNGRLEKKDIEIVKGKIEKVGQDINGKDIIDCKNKLILPGLIDPHVHLRDPGYTKKEDF